MTTLDLRAWIEARHAKEGSYEPLLKALEIKRAHLWRIREARAMPSHHLAERIAALMAEDGITTTAGGITDHQSARIAARVGYVGRDIWPDAPWAKKLEESKS